MSNIKIIPLKPHPDQDIGRKELIKSIAQLLPAEIAKVVSSHIENRDYQADMGDRIFKGLRNGSNILISLPSGLGKTLISQVIATAWSQLPDKNAHKVLVIVPSRLSLNLYPAHTSWLEKYLKVVTLDGFSRDGDAESSFELDQCDMLITTPRTLINGLIHNEIPFGSLRNYSLVVIEDYDALKSSLDTRSGRNRNDVVMLMTFLAASNPRFLFLSSSIQNQGSEINEWENILKPIRVEVNPAHYQDNIPLVNMRLKGVNDPEVEFIDKKLNRTIAVNLGQIKNTVLSKTKNKHPIRVRDILEQMRDIASGKQKEFYIHFRKSPALVIPIDEELKNAFQNISRGVMTRLQLFEDLWYYSESEGIEVQHRPPSSGRRVNLNGKMIAVKEITLERRDKRGLILSRNLEMCELLAGSIINQGLPVFIVHKDLSPAEQRQRMDGFRRQKSAVLLTPRLFGGRNLDVSMVDYAVFYSPKDDEATMWQEMAGIQSVRKNPKEVFILFYRNTGEEDKLKRLLWKMRGRSSYQFLKAEGRMSALTMSLGAQPL